MLLRKASACFLLIPAIPLYAEPMVLDEILVTAQKRVQSLQDVPISVSAVSGEKLSNAGIGKIEDLSAYVPNLTLSETGIGTNIYIRGIGSGINQGFEQSVGMYVDGVYYGRAQLSRAPFLDLERVEVLRGPQSILFGKNSIAGAISMETQKPTEEFEFSVTGLVSPDHGEQELSFILSGPLTERLSARLAYRNRELDGYIENLTLNRDEPHHEEETVRASFKFDLNETTEINFKAEINNFDVYGRQIEIIDDGPGVGQAPTNPLDIKGVLAFQSNSFTYAQILGGLVPGQTFGSSNTVQDFKRSSNGDFSENEATNFTLRINSEWNEHTVSFTSAVVSYEFDENCDCDFTGTDVFNIPASEEFDQISHDLRITSPIGDSFDYSFGLFYQKSDIQFNDAFVLTDSNALIPLLNSIPSAALGLPATFPLGSVVTNLAVPRDFQQDTTLSAIFSQATWNINDQWRLTLGGRLTQEDKSGSRVMTFTDTAGNPITGLAGAATDAIVGILFQAEQHNLSGDRDETKFTPLIRTEFDYSDDLLLYASAAKGYKSGGFDARANTAPGSSVFDGSFEYEDEQSLSFELGSKLRLLDGAGEFNLAVFRTEYDDLQVSIFDGTLGFNVGNAAKAVTQGIEIDSRWRATESLILAFSVAFLDFEFDEFAEGQCHFGQTPTTTTPAGNEYCDYAGETNQYVADWSGAFTSDYHQPIGDSLEFRFVTDWLFSDEYLTAQNLDPATKQDAYVGSWGFSVLKRHNTTQPPWFLVSRGVLT